MVDVNAHGIVADVNALADVIANVTIYYVFMANVIAKGLYVHLQLGRCYWLTIVMDVKTTIGRCCLPSGR